MAKVTIDVDLGELAKDWEAVAFRVPNVGDVHLDVFGRITQCSDPDYTQPRLIVRRKFVWPSWCRAAAICREEAGKWWMYGKMPEKRAHCWHWVGGGLLQLKDHDAEMLGITLPENHDWTVPLLNPNYKAGGDE